ncbi:DUF1488 domain-containing protein [Shewanella gelidimarina]|uniref:DUF1488 domain-containing protein n=1 Tax=Shewanella gelidimarina TaxID=56813 RepID=UPI00200FCF3C|nr:DUF1488 domain-containing protein [Shewanella gelidimarina]MCL1059543.1 DUF1488 domain-containing protein [Shewanella gelidimarina]
MNQSILFPDLQDWEPQALSVVFPVQVQGVNVECRIGLAKLAELSATALSADQHDIASKALTIFDEYRFDIEDEVEQLIEQESFDELGRVILI